MTIDDLIENFDLLDDWEDKYRYLIDLGEKYTTLPAELHQPEWKVIGCQSQVWLVPEVKTDEGKKLLYFQGDSDAAIVKGLIAIVVTLFSGKSKEEILNLDIDNSFAKIGLQEHLSPSRRNGLDAMLEKIKFYAQSLG